MKLLLLIIFDVSFYKYLGILGWIGLLQ